MICCFFFHIKMSYYWFNRQELLQNTKGKYHNDGGKEEAAEYYIANKDVLKEKARNKYRNLSEEKKEAKREYGGNRYKKTKENSSQKSFKKMRYYFFV